MTFYELEKRCKQRRLRRLVLFSSVGVIFFIASLISIIYYKNNTKNSVVKNHKIKKYKIAQNTDNKPLLMPIIPKIDLETLPKNKEVVAVKKKVIVKKTVKEKKDNILKVDTLPSYKECINLANKYLRERKYNLALKWAENANIQNKILPDSWIVSAKALFYSGKKDKAIEILKIYLKYNKDKKVENLLKEFKNEKNS